MQLKPKNCFALWYLVATAAVYAQSAPEQISWYNGDVKLELYAHPQLCALPVDQAERNGAPIQPASHSGYLGQKGGWHIYQRNNQAALNAAADGDCLPVYSSEPDWQHSQLSIQGQGVIVQFKSDLSAQQIEQWLTQHQLKGQSLASSHVYLIEAVVGRKAIELANQLRQAEPVQFAQPNWYVEMSKN